MSIIAPSRRFRGRYFVVLRVVKRRLDSIRSQITLREHRVLVVARGKQRARKNRRAKPRRIGHQFLPAPNLRVGQHDIRRGLAANAQRQIAECLSHRRHRKPKFRAGASVFLRQDRFRALAPFFADRCGLAVPSVRRDHAHDGPREFVVLRARDGADRCAGFAREPETIHRESAPTRGHERKPCRPEKRAVAVGAVDVNLQRRPETSLRFDREVLPRQQAFHRVAAAVFAPLRPWRGRAVCANRISCSLRRHVAVIPGAIAI